MINTHEIEPAVKGLITKTLAEAKALLAQVQSNAGDVDLHFPVDAILTGATKLAEIHHSHKEEVREIIAGVRPEVRCILITISEAAETSCDRHRRDLEPLAFALSDLFGSLDEKPVRTRPGVGKMQMNSAATRL